MKALIRNTEIYFDIAGMQLAPHKQTFIEKPVLFMLHGGPGGDHLRFKQHSLELQDSAQLVFIDHRGCGRSQKTNPADYTLENNVEDIEALRQHLGLERISILGASYGGIVAQAYAIRYPKMVDKLILVATTPSFNFREEAKKFLEQHGTTKQIAFSQHLWNGSFKNSKQVAEFFEVLAPLYSNLLAKKKKSLKKLTSETIWSHEALNKGFSEFLTDFNLVPQLKKISASTLVLSGKHDWICSPRQGKIIADNIPQAKFKIFKDASHSIAVDAHDEYIKLINKFLKQTPKTTVQRKKKAKKVSAKKQKLNQTNRAARGSVIGLVYEYS